jgi:hypothetical protein
MNANQNSHAANLRRGEIYKEIGGRPRLMKFGINTVSDFSQLYNDRPGDFSEVFQRDPFGALRDMIYCGLRVRAGVNELPADFSREMVGDWIDEMEPGEIEEVQTVLLNSLSLGNPTRANLTAAAKTRKN